MTNLSSMKQRFRQSFGDTFADSVRWPDYIIEEALCEADAETGGSGWGKLTDDCHNFKWRGMKYYAAHWLFTNYVDGYDPESGQMIAPGDARLNVAQKSVGDESIGYRVAEMMDAGSDWLTYSNFGQQFYRLRKRAGMGARVSVIHGGLYNH